MIDLNYLNQIKKEIEEFFKKTTFTFSIEFSFSKDNNTLSINLKTEEPRLLIGEKGENLFEMQYLLRMIIRRKFNLQESFCIDLDINDYKKKKSIYLRELARSFAQEVILMKKEKVLPPMPAYERKVIHLELADNPNIATESIGEGDQRRVVIKPYP